MSRGPDAGTLVARAIEHDARRAGCAMVLALAESSRWASATFVGARHGLALDGPDDAAFAHWLAGLPEADLPIRGHVIADLAIVSVARAAGRATASLEALTVET
ncbi:hypothetical protein [Sphingomonas psychrolutea]|uniref:GNAT family N-acetyltransferase n=1 Tax=Sphingomonas psychrolutea TaxID=1259676 RepID=A0ABQ1H4E2_9SPHN|nr:hypothetical protein [Sphingomonas psychrolutea]GGA58340.1 hypothetical protein GCM10011395_30760 [Sphingomonas psychrolutea]